MLIPAWPHHPRGNLHEMAKLYVTRVTSRALVADAMPALHLKADMCSAQADVRLVPIADIGEQRPKQKDRLAAVSPKSDQCFV